MRTTRGPESAEATHAAAAEGLEGRLRDGPPHEVEHQAGRVAVEGLGQGLGVGVPVAGERDRLRARLGGAVEPAGVPSGADDAGGAEQPGVLRGQEAGHPGDAEDQYGAELLGLVQAARSGSQDATPGLTPAATASGDAPSGSGNRIASGEAMRSANVPYGGAPDPVNTSSPPAVRALASRLGVQAPALYWHVPGKQALLDEMATQIWRRISDAMAALPDGLPWREVMATYAETVRQGLLGHRDGAKAFSGTSLTDPDVVGQQESTFENLVRQGFTVETATRGLLLIHHFTIGFCVEEQAVAQFTASCDERYAPGRRAELVGQEKAPLAVEAGDVIFGDPRVRFGELTGLLLDTVGRMRAPRGDTDGRYE